MAYTDEELQIFQRCFELVAEGYTMSSDIETQLRRTFWWMTASRAYILVRTCIRNRKKIEEILAQQNPHNTSNNEPCHRIPCETSS
jgi:hypothetical protein